MKEVPPWGWVFGLSFVLEFKFFLWPVLKKKSLIYICSEVNSTIYHYTLFQMPLHNHPGMHGILKVVHGTVEVAFYNRVEIDTPSDLPEPLRNRPDLLERDIVVPTSNPVKVTVGTNSDPLLLYPNKGSSLLLPIFIWRNKISALQG